MLGVHTGEAMGSGPLRLRGHGAALAEAGLPVEPELSVEAGYWHRSTGAEATHRLVDSGIAFDGLFALNDALGLGALYALQRRGFRVPEDVAVVGFDDIEESRFSVPSLTTIAPDKDAIAREAVARLARRLKSSAGWEPEEVVVDHHLVVRESSAASRA